MWLEIQCFLAFLLAILPVAMLLTKYFISVTKEIEKQGRDLEETTNKLEESERQGQRLQRELESVQDLHRKVSCHGN